ncbi:MAG: 50S ribosomal protein L32 [Proteobacteria bacterium]|nr:50S ribosomal protein L32 [Pseudomonadota bacterium]
MALPPKKHSKSRGRKRRTHDKLDQPSVSLCPQCKEPKRPHYACPHCGYYNNREVIAVKKE